MKIYIEHLEKTVSPWILYEYTHIARTLKETIIITNLCDDKAKKELEKYVKVTCQSVKELLRKPIILDPSSNILLNPQDSKMGDGVVVGGILGDHPPRGRTKSLLTKKFKEPIVRSLGEKQFSIDGAAFVADLVLNKKIELTSIKYIDGLKIERTIGGISHIIELPYRYPLVNNRPFISRELVEYLKKKIMFDESAINR